MRWGGFVEPDYFQFYAKRVGAPWLADVTKETYRDRLWTDGGVVVISTVRKFGTTPVDAMLTAIGIAISLIVFYGMWRQRRRFLPASPQ